MALELQSVGGTMGIALKELVACLDEELQPQLFKDYCPNGLQVEGKDSVGKIITGVTACQALIDKAIELNADALLVHHGYFWKGDDAVLTGMGRRRIESLLKNGISLIAYHLPLDGHPELGNNAQLAKRMGWSVKGGMGSGQARPVGNWGEPDQVMSVGDMASRLEQSLSRKPLVISGGSHDVKTLAWCTGAAQNMIKNAVELGVDAFVSGEISESTVHFARENGIHYFSAGHHATERYGVQALAVFLEKKCGIEHEFIDIDSPV
ncbi:MAG: Nif3-like dinuclear metal center hexameric protein [Candidatus Endonucleobacter bathymodioli]|uniref:GTP cyclohydrolase 1 type 2 homolog n=1 Tax=Candidatus Endonucleibacter bathymodioli TaxID=539814 RepID=A0AA90NP42_9GAMM|nr:Nif3-like dinuclear metal center hexameric protein [Candidatus Endonucleobacter bathymodioli]